MICWRLWDFLVESVEQPVLRGASTCWGTRNRQPPLGLAAQLVEGGRFLKAIIFTMRQSHPFISTGRLELIPSTVDLAEQVVDFYKRNEKHLAPWDPPKPAYFCTESYQRKRLNLAAQDAEAGTAMRWWLCPRNESHTLIGSIGLTAIARGPFQNAMLGYAIDKQLEGQGLMREALLAIIEHAFSPKIHLHRVQANVRPENLRSLRLLESLGFEREGFAKDYLYINGTWRDHVMLALRNQNYEGVPE